MAVKGYVSGFSTRSELAGREWVTIWDFRLERVDDDGNPLPRVPVALKGMHFNSAINDDDLVEVDGSWREGETMWPREVKNLTTAVTIRPRGGRGGLGAAIGTLLGLVIWIALIGGFLYFGWTFLSGRPLF